MPTARLLPLLSLCFIAACGGAGYAAVAPMDRTNTSPAAGPVEHAPSFASPTPSTIAPAPTAKPAPVHSPAATPMSQSTTMTFAIRPLFPGGAGGIVTAVVAAGGVHYHIVVRNLVPGSAHTIHDHLGSCTGAGGSRHLAILDTSRADSSGTIGFDATVPAFDFGAGRIVIVYDTARPLLITGCATL